MTPPFAVNSLLVTVHLPFLLIAVGLVYSATRHDRWDLIVREALAWVIRMGGFLLGLGALLYVLSTWPNYWWVVMFPVLIGMAVYYAWNAPWYRRMREPKPPQNPPPPTGK